MLMGRRGLWGLCARAPAGVVHRTGAQLQFARIRWTVAFERGCTCDLRVDRMSGRHPGRP